jgi:flagellar hook-associated protein 2
MATISSLGIGTSGLDVQSIVSQLVALEKKPLETLKLRQEATEAKITSFGQIKSLIDTLNSAVGKLASVSGWNAVKASSSAEDYVTASAIGGTQLTSFDVKVQQLAAARSTTSMALAKDAYVGAGTLKFTVGTSTTEISIGALDKLTDVASKINGSNAGVSATIMTDPVSGQQRLMLRGKETGTDNAFQLEVLENGAVSDDDTGLSRLVYAPAFSYSGPYDPADDEYAADYAQAQKAWEQTYFHESQAAQNAKATVNGIAVESASNTFTDVVAGVSLTVKKVTGATDPAATVSITKDTTEMKANIEAFVKAYNEANTAISEAIKYDSSTKVAGLFQGDSTMLTLQNALRSALQTVSTSGGAFSTLSSIGIGTAGSADPSAINGNLVIDEAKLSKALENPDALKGLFSSTAAGSAQGIAVKIRSVTSALLSVDGFFKRKDDALKREKDGHLDQEERIQDKVSRIEEQLTRRYSALDVQMSSLNSLSTYLEQQISQWNKAK